MRIACIAGRYPCWSEQFLRRDLEALSARGHEILVWPAEAEPGLLRWTTVEGTPLPPHVGAASNFRLKSAFRALTDCGIAQLRRLPLVLRMRDLLPWHPDEVWGAFGSLPAVLGAALAAGLGQPLTLSLHARDIWVPWHPGWKALQQARQVLVCNQSGADELLRSHPGLEGALQMIRHALPETSFGSAPAERGALPPLILAAGRFVEKKGFEHLLRCLPRVRERLPAARLLLVGEGPLDSTYRQIRREIGLDAESVRIQPRLTADALQDRMAKASVLAISSVVAHNGDRDGIPNVMLEAMARRTPVVATTVGGIPEVLDETCGWLVPPADASALAAALVEGLSDPEAAHRRTEKAQARIRELFSPEQTVDRLESALTSVSG